MAASVQRLLQPSDGSNDHATQIKQNNAVSGLQVFAATAVISNISCVLKAVT
ncbi:hypothetical protein QN360_12595 [Glaciimonas sp. CA11.2]|uniref:hypothetical protein n=1 Tax=Glaciimonas sp. CA11.2 TaxID=3048601 RepID=UPI002B22ED25|nr:hypothetical protein [Glaciimonas sp. CA11.2]MEB0163739.1 hypothetical protein [Glaciimonas sp. CA11.2]